jgi:hypothetical protein
VQTSPAAQTVPELLAWQSAVAPQWLRSVEGMTQMPAQFTCPVGHETLQVPLLQTSPALQTAPACPLPHAPLAPQWSRSMRGSTQVPPQFTSPV